MREACFITWKKPFLGESLLPALLASITVLLIGCGDRSQAVTSPAGLPTQQATRTATPAQPAGGSAPTAGAVREISFDDIAFEMEKGSAFTRDLLPERVLALAGQRVRIRGYILPSFQQTGLTQFVLVRDNMECCFGPGAALYDCIVVTMEPGRAADFSVRPVAVTGTFRLNELKGPDGKHLAIYALTGEQVR